MPTFVWRCTECGHREERDSRMQMAGAACLGECPGTMRRDYRAEGANVALANLKEAR